MGWVHLLCSLFRKWKKIDYIWCPSSQSKRNVAQVCDWLSWLAVCFMLLCSAQGWVWAFGDKRRNLHGRSPSLTGHLTSPKGLCKCSHSSLYDVFISSSMPRHRWAAVLSASVILLRLVRGHHTESPSITGPLPMQSSTSARPLRVAIYLPPLQM